MREGGEHAPSPNHEAKPPVIHPLLGISKLGPTERQPHVWLLSPRTNDLCYSQNATCTQYPPTNHDGQPVALFHQVGSELTSHDQLLSRTYSFSNFGVSTSKQCCSHFLAFSCRPCIRSTLCHCGRVGGGIQQMQTYTSAFEARQVLCFLIPPFPFPFRLPSLCIRPAAQDFQSLGTLAPRIIGLWEWFCC